MNPFRRNRNEKSTDIPSNKVEILNDEPRQNKQATESTCLLGDRKKYATFNGPAVFLWFLSLSHSTEAYMCTDISFFVQNLDSSPAFYSQITF